MSKFSDYLHKQGIDPRRVLVASKKLEALQPEDRAIKLLKKQIKKEENSKKEPPQKKPRSGKPVTQPTLNRALKGDELSSAAKQRLYRAINAVLKQKKKGEADLGDLF